LACQAQFNGSHPKFHVRNILGGTHRQRSKMQALRLTWPIGDGPRDPYVRCVSKSWNPSHTHTFAKIVLSQPRCGTTSRIGQRPPRPSNPTHQTLAMSRIGCKRTTQPEHPRGCGVKVGIFSTRFQIFGRSIREEDFQWDASYQHRNGEFSLWEHQAVNPSFWGCPHACQNWLSFFNKNRVCFGTLRVFSMLYVFQHLLLLNMPCSRWFLERNNL
jgi:hypothetical protein